MNRDEMIRRVRRLDFIKNEQTADAAMKAVLGILIGNLNEEHARKLTETFPDSLVPASIPGEQKRTISVKEHTAEIRNQFKISNHEAVVLFRNVLYTAKEASGHGVLIEIGKSMTADWAQAIQNA